MDSIDHFLKSSFPKEDQVWVQNAHQEGKQLSWDLGEFIEALNLYQFRNGTLKANKIRYSGAFVVKLISTKEEES